MLFHRAEKNCLILDPCSNITFLCRNITMWPAFTPTEPFLGVVQKYSFLGDIYTSAPLWKNFRDTHFLICPLFHYFSVVFSVEFLLYFQTSQLKCWSSYRPPCFPSNRSPICSRKFPKNTPLWHIHICDYYDLKLKMQFFTFILWADVQFIDFTKSGRGLSWAFIVQQIVTT